MSPPASRPSTREVEFWFDFSCPYAYLGFTQIRALAERTGAQLSLRPMLLGGVFRARETPQNLAGSLSPAKARHNANDLRRFAQLFDVPLVMPDAHPMRTVEALRALIVAGEPHYASLAEAFYRAYWVDGVDIRTPEARSTILTGLGHDSASIEARITEPSVKDALRGLTDEAIERGVFGAPAMFVDGELYWGQDRLDEVEEALGGTPERVLSFDAIAHADTPRTEVFFDYASPFCYVIAHRAPELLGPKIRWRPLDKRALLRDVNGSPDVPVMSEAKARFRREDLERTCRRWNLPVPNLRDAEPESSLALRVTHCLLEGATGREVDFIRGVFDAAWIRGRDIEDPQVLVQLAHGLGIDGEDLVERATADEAAFGELGSTRKEALERDVFGVPTVIVPRSEQGEDVYFGQDRLELAVRAARGDPRAR